MRRLLLGMNQDGLAKAIGLTFQQVQKYERGANRISASRLADVAKVLDVPIAFFFSGLPAPDDVLSVEDRQWQDWTEEPETIELVRFYHAIPHDGVRQQLRDLVKEIAGASTGPRETGGEAPYLRQLKGPRRNRPRRLGP